MLEKKVTFDHQVLEDGQIQVRRITRIMEDGKELSKAYHRHCVDPISDLTLEDTRTKLITGVLYTPAFTEEFIEKRRLAEEANGLLQPVDIIKKWKEVILNG